LADSIDENNETFVLNFGVVSGSVAQFNSTGAQTAGTTFTISSQNSASTKPFAYVEQPNTVLTKNGTTPITIRLNKNSGKTITINYSLQSGATTPCGATATLATVTTDFTFAGGTLTFLAGAQSATLDITTTASSGGKCLILKLDTPVNLHATPFSNNGDATYTSIPTPPPDVLLKAFFIQP
jgi:hypothetical protein